MNIDFYFDFISPYTYLASTRLDRLEDAHGVSIRWEPALLGGIMKATGNSPPAALPARAQYMFDDLHRWSALYGVPFTFNTSFPFNSILPMRVALAIRRDEGDAAHARDSKYRRFIAKAFEAVWVHDRNLGNRDLVVALAEQVGVTPERALAANDDPAIKEQLKAQTEQALAAGAFGMPAFVLTDGEQRELYFGNDRLELLEARLQRAQPWPKRPPISVSFT